MQWYHLALLAMAGLAVIFAWRVPGAAKVVCVGTAFAVMTSVWHINQWPYGLLFGAWTNFAMCVGLSLMQSDAPWISRLFRCYILMILVELLFVTGVIETQYIFAVTLEIINAYALLLIWATGIAERVGDGHSFSNPYRRFLADIHRALLTERKEYSQWWKHP